MAVYLTEVPQLLTQQGILLLNFLLLLICVGVILTHVDHELLQRSVDLVFLDRIFIADVHVLAFVFVFQNQNLRVLYKFINDL